MRRKLFINKATRDKAWKTGCKQGYRSTVHGACMHPMYVSDYETETGKRLSPADKGLGNGLYKTRFSTLYIIDL